MFFNNKAYIKRHINDRLLEVNIEQQRQS